MKKLLFLVFLLAAGVGAGVLAQRGLIPGVGSEKNLIKQKTGRFLECLKFKEFREAAAFHTAEDLKANPDIPKQLESFFKIPHENLDIQDIQLDFIEFDSTGTRSKAKTTTTVHVLNRSETKRIESMLYWKKVDGQWYLDLRTTLERGAAAPF